MTELTPASMSLDVLLQSALDGLFVIDRTRKVVMFSAGCERITGYPAPEVLGFECRCYDVTKCQDEPGRSLAGALCPAKAIFDGCIASARQRMRIRRRDGKWLWIETNYTAVRDRAGELDCVLGVVRDATEARAREEELLGVLSELRQRVELLGREQASRYGFGNIVSRAPAMIPVFEKIRAALGNASTVLISGQSGVGKEVVARTIHVHGIQKAGPFVPLNCSALPRDLIESELFGHVKGAFTGAVQDYQGLLHAAEGGTIFLDEIGAMPLETQAKLLRTLQDKRVRPVGSTVEVPVQVRVIAAMQERPREAVAAGRLREDLFYRLGVIGIEVPPLRDRKEDIPLLVQRFIEELNLTSRRQVQGVAPDVWNALADYSWPGNVRELSNAVESAFAIGGGPVLRREEFPQEVYAGPPCASQADEAASLRLRPLLAQVERDAILRAIRAAGGLRNKAAKLMGVSRSRLYRRMQALGINPGDAA